ncbi:hypothetical protein [Pseudomonas fluorescens group sp. PF-69]
MNFLDTTAGSTYAVNVAIQRFMPPAEAATVLAILDAYRAAPTAAKVARAQRAREAKAARKRAAVSAGVERYRPQLVSWTGTPTARAKWLAKLLGPDAPHWRYVYDHLKTMQI